MMRGKWLFHHFASLDLFLPASPWVHKTPRLRGLTPSAPQTASDCSPTAAPGQKKERETFERKIWNVSVYKFGPGSTNKRIFCKHLIQ